MPKSEYHEKEEAKYFYHTEPELQFCKEVFSLKCHQKNDLIVARKGVCQNGHLKTKLCQNGHRDGLVCCQLATMVTRKSCLAVRTITGN